MAPTRSAPSRAGRHLGKYPDVAQTAILLAVVQPVAHDEARPHGETDVVGRRASFADEQRAPLHRRGTPARVGGRYLAADPPDGGPDLLLREQRLELHRAMVWTKPA